MASSNDNAGFVAKPRKQDRRAGAPEVTLSETLLVRLINLNEELAPIVDPQTLLQE